MPKDTLRDILLRIESQLDRHDQRFDAIDQRFDGVDQRLDGHDQRFEAMDQRLDEQKVHLNTLTEFTVTSLNSIDGKMQTMNRRLLKLELSFEEFRSDTRAYWEQLSETRATIAQHEGQLEDHEERLSKLEAG